jgi:hypothetical protein
MSDKSIGDLRRRRVAARLTMMAPCARRLNVRRWSDSDPEKKWPKFAPAGERYHFVNIVIRGRALDCGVGAAGEIDSVSQAL